jgi:hypothetical protein
MILRSYDDLISMDWWESHDVILNGKMRRLSWNDDEGKRSVIIGRKQGESRGSFLSYNYKRACERMQVICIFSVEHQGHDGRITRPSGSTRFWERDSQKNYQVCHLKPRWNLPST